MPAVHFNIHAFLFSLVVRSGNEFHSESRFLQLGMEDAVNIPAPLIVCHSVHRNGYCTLPAADGVPEKFGIIHAGVAVLHTLPACNIPHIQDHNDAILWILPVGRTFACFVQTVVYSIH